MPKYCKCGCGKEIVWQRHHKWRGSPDYLRMHNPASKRKPTKGWTILNGYRMILIPDPNGGTRGKYRFEHRVVMEAMLGRPLLRSEIVHHRDHNRLNNDPANLELLNHRTHGHTHHKPGIDARSHVHKHYNCECGKSTGLGAEWREQNAEQRVRDLGHDAIGRFVSRKAKDDRPDAGPVAGPVVGRGDETIGDG